jgi:hypothetical protein
MEFVKSTGVLRRASQYGSITLPDSGDDRLTVKLWEKRSISERPLLRIQLVGRGIISIPLAVEEFHRGRPQLEPHFVSLLK